MPVLIECIVSRCTLWCPQKRVEFESTFIPLDERQLFGNIIGVPFVEHTIESDFYTRFKRKCYPAHEPIVIAVASGYLPKHQRASRVPTRSYEREARATQILGEDVQQLPVGRHRNLETTSRQRTYDIVNAILLVPPHKRLKRAHFHFHNTTHINPTI